MNIKDLDAFTRAYIECALWSSDDNADDSGGEPLDKNYSIEDIAPESLASMAADCAKFQVDNAGLLNVVYDVCSLTRAGHCFWLNRNGHGSGFWDEFFGKDEALNKAFHALDVASKEFGTCDIDVGDDKKLYIM